MSHDDACDRARKALMDVCGEGEDRFNTVFVEVVVEQGSPVRSNQLNTMTEWAKGIVRDATYLEGPQLPRNMRLEPRDVFVIRGDERPQETEMVSGNVGGVRVDSESAVFSGEGDNRYHLFFPFENNTMNMGQLKRFEDDVRRTWDRTDISRGKAIMSVNVVDPAVARAAAPQRTGRPMEDIERF